MGREKGSLQERTRQLGRKNAIKLVSRSEIPIGANIIGSHVVYLQKPNGTIKARIVPWRNHDFEREFLRTDAPCMSMEVFRLLLSLTVERNWEICEMDIKAAFLQAANFNCEVFVRPPKEECSEGIL